MSSQAKLGFDPTRAAYLLSALHKYIRRSRPFEAMSTGLDLAEMAPSMFWGEITTIAVEDVAQPLEIVAIGMLKTQYEALSKENQVGKGRLWITDACKILAEAPKDRRADEFLHTLKSRGYAGPKALLAQVISSDPEIRDAIEDKHTYEGKQKGRGYAHFVEEGSKCTKMVPEYEKWRKLWVEAMKGIPGDLL